MRVIDREQAKCVAGFRSTTRANCRLLALTRAGLLRRFFLGTDGRSASKRSMRSRAKAPQLAGVALPRTAPSRTDEILVADFFVMHQLAINEMYCILKYAPIPDPDSQVPALGELSRADRTRARRSFPTDTAELRPPARTLAAFLEVDLGNESRTVWRSEGAIVPALRHLREVR